MYGRREWRGLNSMKLKIWNGGGWRCNGDCLYICGKNRKHAATLHQEAHHKYYNLTHKITKSDIDRAYRHIAVYFHEGCWGNAMDGIEPEIGVWYAPPIGGGHAGKPERII